MKIMKIFNRDDWKRSKKIKALHKVLDKLKTNKHHRRKAEKLIRELE